MKKQAKHLEPSMNAMASAVGDFIRYWGFRRIHGQIWTWLYLSQTPLSGADLVRRLKVSKALVNPALHELVNYQLIHIVPEASDDKTQKFAAQPRVMEVIRNILKEREAQLIAKAQFCQSELTAQAADMTDITNNFNKDSIISLNKSRLNNLGEMIQMAGIAVEFLSQMEGFEV